jgi:hypothetical protein
MNEPIKCAIVWVTGGRDYMNKERVFELLTAYHKKHRIAWIITGSFNHEAYIGADTFSVLWALANQIPFTVIPAEWDRFGNIAGPVRNEVISKTKIDGRVFDCQIAFPGGTGTKGSVCIARELGKPVYTIDWEG